MEQTNDAWRATRRLWPVIVLATVLGAVTAFATGSAARPNTPRYAATTTLLFPSGTDAQIGSIPLPQVAVLTTTGEVPKEVAGVIAWNGEPAELAAQVRASMDTRTRALSITTQQADAARAVTITDAFADELVTYLERQHDVVLRAEVATSLKHLEGLRSKAAELSASSLLNPDDAVIKTERDATLRQYGAQYEQHQQLADALASSSEPTVERAEPVALPSTGDEPLSRTARIPFGALAGALLGLGIVVLLDRFDGRVRDPRRAELSLGAPVIAELATLPREERDAQLCVKPSNQSHVAESFRTLRTTLTFLTKGDGPQTSAPVIVVTSPSPGDGKTTTAANLAAAFAETCERVVVVNADFRNPRVTQFFLTKAQPDPLSKLKEFDGLGPEHFLRRTANRSIRVVDLSRLRAPAGELSRATARVVAGLRPWVDVIIIDTPPLGVTAEALEFVNLASVALVIARVGRTRVRRASRAGEILRLAGATTVAVALTDSGSPLRTGTAYDSYTYVGPQKTLDALLPANLEKALPGPAATTTADAMDSQYGSGWSRNPDAGSTEGAGGGAADARAGTGAGTGALRLVGSPTERGGVERRGVAGTGTGAADAGTGTGAADAGTEVAAGADGDGAAGFPDAGRAMGVQAGVDADVDSALGARAATAIAVGDPDLSGVDASDVDAVDVDAVDLDAVDFDSSDLAVDFDSSDFDADDIDAADMDAADMDAAESLSTSADDDVEGEFMRAIGELELLMDSPSSATYARHARHSTVATKPSTTQTPLELIDLTDPDLDGRDSEYATGDRAHALNGSAPKEPYESSPFFIP